MKTPLQLHIDSLYKWKGEMMNEIYPTPKTQVILETIDKSIRLAEKMLEKEKEVMREFAVKCMHGIEYGLLQSEVKTYYNETFNTKEK
jgi:hypothetical protein